jgi:hypothetical protein
MATAIKTKSGRLTAYGFACGYVEEHEKDQVRTVLWHEGATFHVRQHDHKQQKRIFWDTFTSITEARRRFDKAKRGK